MRVRGLRVVHPHDVISVPHQLVAVRAGLEGTQTRTHGLRLDVGGTAQGGRGQGVLDRVLGRHLTRRGGQILHDAQFERLVVAVLQEGPVHDDVLGQTEHRHGRHLGGAEANRASALHHVGLLHHAQGVGVVGVEDAGHLGVLVHAGLIDLVTFEGTVPIHVILGNVQHDRGVGRQGEGPVQLEARQLHREKLVGLIVGNRVHNRHAHVAHLNGFLARGLQNRIRHTHGRGLAVRAGQAQPLGAGAAGTVVEAPSQLHVTPHLDTALVGIQHHGVVGANTRRGHHQLGVLPFNLRQGEHVLGAEQAAHRSVRVTVNLDALTLLGGVHPVDNRDARTQLREHIRGGVTAGTHPHDHDVQTGPGGVPAGQLREALVLVHRVDGNRLGVCLAAGAQCVLFHS